MCAASVLTAPLVPPSGWLLSCLLKIPISFVLFEVCPNVLSFFKCLLKEGREEIPVTKVTKTYGFLALTHLSSSLISEALSSVTQRRPPRPCLSHLSVSNSFAASLSCPETDTFSSTCSDLSSPFSLPWWTQSLLWLQLGLQCQWS